MMVKERIIRYKKYMSYSSSDTIYQDVAASHVCVTKLMLQAFRSYAQLSLECSGEPVVLTGHNGAGKTNILEAISFLAPGRGLRGAKLTDVDHVNGGAWVVSANLDVDGDAHFIGTGRSPDAGVRSKRVIHVNATQNVSQSELANLSTIMWQTPQMDGLFLAGASERRSFIDRIVYHFDVLHARRVNQYEHAVRERMRLLQMQSDPAWITVLEQQIVAEGVAVAVARNDVVNLIAASIEKAPSAFPKAIVAMEGDIEEMLLAGNKALEIEEFYMQKLFENRVHDARSGRTQFGVHRSDLSVFHAEKEMPAKLCSTGEQKALLLSIILAEARAKALWKGSVPILLLDEVVAHLDNHRRAALFEEILAMKAQCWMTGTDHLLFDALEGKAQFFNVENATVTCA